MYTRVCKHADTFSTNAHNMKTQNHALRMHAHTYVHTAHIRMHYSMYFYFLAN